jgi:hypothetical protein
MKTGSAQLPESTLGSESSVYLWTFPGAPVRIEIELDVIARLEAAVMRNQSNDGAIEIGGVLLGDFRSPCTVEIRDFVLVAGDPGTKNGYVADTFELERVWRTSPLPRGRVVGYFRTQSEESLELRDDEIGAVRQHFGDSRQVVLLIRSYQEQSTAGFLFWDRGALSPFSFLEFPLSAEALRSKATLNPGAVSAEPVRTVNVAPRVAPVPSRLRSRLLKGLAAGLLIGLVALAAVFSLRTRAAPHPEPPPAQPAAVEILPESAPLQLQVEAQGDGLNVRWNSQSKAIASAKEGRLTVNDNQSSRVISLNSRELTRGHVYYRPSGDRVEFELVAVDEAGVSTAESVLALLSKPENRAKGFAPTASRTSVPTEKNPKNDGGVRQAPRVFTIPLRPKKEEPAEPVLIQDSPPLAPAEMVSATKMPPVTGRIVVPQLPPLRPPERPPNPEPALASSEGKPSARPADRFQFAEPKKKTNPIVPPWTAALLPPTGGVAVVVRVHIDEAGRVTRAEASSKGPKSAMDKGLEKAATDAVMHWLFEPARLNDKPVANEQDVDFIFRRSRP